MNITEVNWKLLLEPHVLAVVVSLLATWGSTEMIKRAARGLLNGRAFHLAPILLGFVVGTLIGTFSWPPDTEVEPLSFGLTIGFSAPLIYAVVVRIIRWKWPDIANKITGSRQ